MNESKIPAAAIGLSGLAIEYCRALDSCAGMETRDFCAEMLRYLPRIYITAFDARPYGDDSLGADNGAIIDELDEDRYNMARDNVASVLGEYEMYLDTQVDDMQFSDTPVAVSLAEKLADIYQAAYDFAATMREAPVETVADVLADFKYRFDNYLHSTLASALAATDRIYHSL